MASVARPLLRLLLSLALVGGMTVQFVPIAVAHGDLSVRGHMSSDCDGPQPPCSGHMPYCIDHVGCAAAPAVPVSPATLPVLIAWTTLDYDLAPRPLLGISVKPELSPPILAV